MYNFIYVYIKAFPSGSRIYGVPAIFYDFPLFGYVIKNPWLNYIFKKMVIEGKNAHPRLLVSILSSCCLNFDILLTIEQNFFSDDVE